MAVKIRLARGGTKKKPYYQIVVADTRSPRDGRFLQKVGGYNPLLAADDDKRVVLEEERIRHWLARGAKPTDRVARFLDKAGILPRKPRNNPNRGKPGAKAIERAEAAAAAAAQKQEAAEAEAAAS